jgi:uncharacterized membrane protein
MDRVHGGPSVLPEVQRISTGDIGEVLRLGFRDFLRAPLFGLFFAAVYVAGGLLMLWVFGTGGREWWLVPVIVGFPILGPFAAVGLYEVSRRIEAGLGLRWGDVLGVVFAQRNRQVPALAAVVVVLFLFWIFVAHAIFALFVGMRAFSGEMGIIALFTTGNGPLMLLIGGAIGAGFAGVLFAATVTGLPLLLDHEVDFVSAMILSFQCVSANPVPMLAWGATITGLLVIGMAPWFLGLFVALPVLGHATWHMYRRLLHAPS